MLTRGIVLLKIFFAMKVMVKVKNNYKDFKVVHNH